MKALLALIALTLLLMIMPAMTSGKSISAYFNGQEATVSGVVLHAGEQFTIDLYITPDRESYAYAEIDEPGVTRAYDLLGGDDLIPKAFKSCNASSAAHYRWIMAANENWLYGTAPLNIYYQVNEPGNGDPCTSGLFSVVEAYIIPAEASDQPDSATPENISTSGFATSAICIMAAIIVLARKRG